MSLHETVRADRDPIQGVANDVKIFTAGLGDHQSLMLPVEQPDAEYGFQRFDLMTNRTESRDHPQNFRR